MGILIVIDRDGNPSAEMYSNDTEKKEILMRLYNHLQTLEHLENYPMDKRNYKAMGPNKLFEALDDYACNNDLFQLYDEDNGLNLGNIY